MPFATRQMPYLGLDPSRIPRSALDEWQNPRASFGYEPFARPSNSPYERPFDLPMSEGEYATKLRSIAAEKARKARALGSAADSQRAIQLFDGMTPEQTARIYSGAPQSADEAEIQRRLQQSETAGTLGFNLGYASDIANVKNNRARAVFDRQIRDSDLLYNLRQDSAEQAAEQHQFNMDQKMTESERRDQQLGINKQKVDQQFEARREKNAEVQTSRRYRAAEDMIYGNEINSEADINRLFPDLPQQERDSLRSKFKGFEGEKRTLFNDLSKQAQQWNSQLDPMKTSADALAKSAWEKEQPPWYSRKPDTPQQKRGLSASESDLIRRAQTATGGALVYDTETGTFVPAPSYITPPSPSDNPIATDTGGFSGPLPAGQTFTTTRQVRPQVRRQPAYPQSTAPSVRPRAYMSGDFGNDPAASGGVSYQGLADPSYRFASPNATYRDTGDYQIDAVNRMLRDDDRARLREGQVKVGPTGKRYIYRGRYFEPLP